MKQLIVNADDFGIATGVSRGIFQLLVAERISSTSAMTLTPEWVTDGVQLKSMGPQRVGIHITLTDLSPLGPMPILAPKGKLSSFGALYTLALRKKLPAQEIKAEIERQFAAFIDITGFAPGHADGHQHVQQIPGIRDIFLDVCARFSPQLRYIRVSNIPLRQCMNIKTASVALGAAGFRRQAQRRSMSANSSFSGTYGFDITDIDYAHYFQRFLTGLQDGGLIMCHPGFVDNVLQTRDPVTYSREKEQAFFAGDHYLEILRAQGWQLKI